MAKQNKEQPKAVFQGRTKNDIRHLHFCAELFGTTFEEMLKTPVITYNDNPKKWERIDNMNHAEYMEHIKQVTDY